MSTPPSDPHPGQPGPPPPLPQQPQQPPYANGSPMLAQTPPLVPGQAPASGAYAPPGAAVRARNPFGTVALVTAVAALVLGLIQLVSQAMMLARADAGGYQALAATGLLFLVVESLLAMVALICGIAGLVARDRPKAVAGVGLGIAIAVLTSSAGSALYSGLIRLFTSF